MQRLSSRFWEGAVRLALLDSNGPRPYPRNHGRLGLEYYCY